jgi:N-acetylmuramoyl-L-alanine amidase
MPDDLSGLIAEIRKLVEKLDAPKNTDWSQKIAAMTPFLSTVLLAAVSLWLTWSNQQGQIRLAQESAKHDKAFHDAQIRIAELEAISKLVPTLSSKDPLVRKRGEELLQALQQSKVVSANEVEETSPAMNRKGTTEVTDSRKSLGETYALIIANDNAVEASRLDAIAKITKEVGAPGTPVSERRRAEEVLAKVADSPTAPPAVRRAAQFAIADIRHVNSAKIAELVKNELVSRKIEEVILHHSGNPINIGAYKGYPTIFNIAKFQMEAQHWDRVGFHYAVAPDGTIWIGVPLDDIAFHTAAKNPTTVGVMLIMDGESELPTPAQRTALVELLKALFAKLKIKATDNFAQGHGFHRDYSLKSCPGKLMTKEMVLSWLNEDTTSHN